MIRITATIALNEDELDFQFIRAPGPGGQNVNKVASAVQLKFNVLNSTSLPELVRHRLLTLLKTKITARGEFIIKATRFRSQERNKEDAVERLIELIRKAAIVPKKRIKTRPSVAAKQNRLDEKHLRAKTKARRRRQYQEE